MSIKRQRGISLIELVLAIVILSVGVAGLVSAFMTSVAGSADPLVNKQMLSIAEQLMEEITLQPFAPAAPAQANIPGPCAARDTFNDVFDYHGLQTTNGFCTSDGTSIPNLAAYNVQVAVNAAAALNTSTNTGNLGGGDVYRITITVTHGANNMQLVGWRTNYANNLD